MQNAHPQKKILIVTSNLKSHPYAAAKLASLLAERHRVTLAGPNGSALSRLQAEVKSYHESTTAKNKIECISIGDAAVASANIRPVVNPKEYSPLRIIANVIFNPNYNPSKLPSQYEQLMDDQVGTYETLKKIILQYDLVYAVHSCAPTVCDAIESLQLESYESSFIYKGLWKKSRYILALPHVSTYGYPVKPTRGFVRGIVAYVLYLIQLFWMWLDCHLTEKAWRLSGIRNDKRRAERGLPPVFDGARYYWRSYPVLSLGGVKPYIGQDIIAENVTVVNQINKRETGDLKRLYDWIIRARVNKIIYASFGTGTQLSDDETVNIAKLAVSLKDTKYCLLLSLQKSEQVRLRHIFDKVIGSHPTSAGSGFLEYMGYFRIDEDVPQENLLLSNKVDVFVSHMGFGSFTEGVNGGVPFVTYPAGLDQYHNEARAIEAGIAIKANPKNLDITVIDALWNDSMKENCRQLASDAADFDSSQVILNMADDICNGDTSETDSWFD